MIFQDPYASLNPRMTVGDIIGEGWKIHPDVVAKDEAISDRVKELLDVVGLNPDHINRYPHQFSGGQRQRIGIARALALEPSVIIADEPVSALDVSVQAQVVNLLAGSPDRSSGCRTCSSRTTSSVVRHICDRVAVMYLGKIVEIGADEAIYERTTHPYTEALLSAVPVPDPTSHARTTPDPAGRRRAVAGQPAVGLPIPNRCWKAQDICAEQEPLLVAHRRVHGRVPLPDRRQRADEPPRRTHRLQRQLSVVRASSSGRLVRLRPRHPPAVDSSRPSRTTA